MPVNYRDQEPPTGSVVSQVSALDPLGEEYEWDVAESFMSMSASEIDECLGLDGGGSPGVGAWQEDFYD